MIRKIHYKNPIIFFNPQSAGGRTKRKFDFIKRELNNADFNFETTTFVETKKDVSNNNELIKKELEKQKYDLIITIGGDGTISSIVNGMYILSKDLHRPIMPIPFGSGNSLLRDFKIRNVKDVLYNYQKIMEPKKFDLLSVENATGFHYYCINILGMGFIADTVTEVLKFHKKYGSLSYFIGILKALKIFTSYNVDIEIGNSETPKKLSFDKALFISMSNTTMTGGGIMIAPHASYCDGLMDLVVLHNLTKFAFLRGFFKAIKGKHIAQKGCEYIQTDKIKITSNPNFLLMPDGELDGESPVTVSVVRSAVELIV